MRGTGCELLLPLWPSPLSSSSALNNSNLLLFGKSIAFQQKQQPQRSHPKTTAQNNKTLINDNSKNPMGHIKRIRQLFLPVCAHEVKHEIANHYRDVKNKKASKEARAKAKRTVAALYRQQQLQHQQQLQELRKKATFAKFVSTTIVHRRRTIPPPQPSSMHQYHHRRSIPSHQRDVLQIPSCTYPRVISHESAINGRKGRQTLCNLRQPNDLYSSVQASGNNTTTTTLIPLNRLIQKGRRHRRKDLSQLFTSFESNACNAKATQIKPNSFQSIATSWPFVEHRAQTCDIRHHPPPPSPSSSHCCCRVRRKSERQTCTTNQQKSHVGIRTVTTKTPAPNCNDYYHRQQRKTYSSSRGNKNTQNRSTYTDNRDCINSKTIDTNKTGWYIQLASNCYRNGFQLHVNHLDEWSKHPCVVQRKPIQVLSFLRLPSSALQPTNSVTGKKTVRILHDDQSSISTVCDFLVDSSIIAQQQSIRVACEQINLNCANKNVLNLPHHQLQNNADDIKRIYVKTLLKSSDTHHSKRSIDDSSKLSIIDTEQNQQDQQHIDKIKQFDTPTAKNTMNSIEIDANIHLQPTTNCQLTCQTIQNNYHNNNLTFDREFHAGAEQTVPHHTLVIENSIATTAGAAAAAVDAAVAFTAIADANNIADTAIATKNNNNNNQQHWLIENNSNAIVSTNPQSIETRPTTATNDIDIDIDDLIESFSTTFDVTDSTERHKLPQIVLSDFSNNQLSSSLSSSPPPPPTTPLAFAIQSTHTLSEHPDQLQELQQFFYQAASTQ